MVAVLRLGLSRPLRGLIALALVSLGVSLVLRGVWGGPWLMDIKGLSRVEAGNQLGAFTIAMIIGPLCIGMIDRKLGHRRGLVASTHAMAGVLLALMALGAPGYAVSALFGVNVMPPTYDLVLFVLIGLSTSAQPLLFGMSRQLVDAQTALLNQLVAVMKAQDELVRKQNVAALIWEKAKADVARADAEARHEAAVKELERKLLG